MRESKCVTDFPMTRRDVEYLYTRMRDSKEYLESQRDMPKHTNSTSDAAMQAAATFAGAGAVGYAAGKMGTTSFGNTGIPVGLTAAVVGHILARFGPLRGHAGTVEAAANGAGAAWFALWAAGQGSGSRARAGDSTPIVSGQHASPMQLPAHQNEYMPPSAPRQMGGGGVPGRPLSEAELQAIQQVSRQVGYR